MFVQSLLRRYSFKNIVRGGRVNVSSNRVIFKNIINNNARLSHKSKYHTTCINNFFHSFLPEVKVAGKKYNRWQAVPAAVVTHLCLGSVYSWSLLNDPLTRVLGVVVPSVDDWSSAQAMGVFSTILVLQGLAAAVVGKWQLKVGGRASGILGAFCFGGGFVLCGVGALFHSYPLLLFGGFLSGCGIGLAYVPPVAKLLAWFPDKRGLATGMTITGFGGGALLSTPAIKYLLNYFSSPPEFVGNVESVPIIVKDSKRFVDVAGELKEVVFATKKDLLNFSDLSEGVYIVSSGSTGVGMTLAVLGSTYIAVMLAAAISYRIPRPGYLPPGFQQSADSKLKIKWEDYVPVDNVMRTPQFWQVWITFMCLSTAGMAVVSVANNMMLDVFSVLPIVTTTFAAGYLMALSGANLGGRLGWSALSDKVGRKRMFTAFAATSIPLYLLIPYCAEVVSVGTGGNMPLIVFYGSTIIIFSFFGAGYATTPAYESDLFGSKEVGAIHGRMLTASSVASILGPMGVTSLKERSETNAIKELVANIDDNKFYNTFKTSKDSLDELIQSKQISINLLMKIAPSGTIDPSPLLYNTTFYSAASLLCIAAVSNIMIKPVDRKYFVYTTSDGKTVSNEEFQKSKAIETDENEQTTDENERATDENEQTTDENEQVTDENDQASGGNNNMKNKKNI